MERTPPHDLASGERQGRDLRLQERQQVLVAREQSQRIELQVQLIERKAKRIAELELFQKAHTVFWAGGASSVVRSDSSRALTHQCEWQFHVHPTLAAQSDRQWHPTSPLIRRCFFR